MNDLDHLITHAPKQTYQVTAHRPDNSSRRRPACTTVPFRITYFDNEGNTALNSTGRRKSTKLLRRVKSSTRIAVALMLFLEQITACVGNDDSNKTHAVMQVEDFTHLIVEDLKIFFMI